MTWKSEIIFDFRREICGRHTPAVAANDVAL
jgi:hypothetical protein